MWSTGDVVRELWLLGEDEAVTSCRESKSEHVSSKSVVELLERALEDVLLVAFEVFCFGIG